MHFLLLFGIVLLPKAHSLKCYECMPALDGSSCKPTEKECQPGQQCSALNMVTSVGSQKVDVNMKTCAMAEQCLQGSVNFGPTRVTYNNKCCATDLCNSANAEAYSKNARNGKMCYYCDGKQCSATMECMGDEDRCFSVSVVQGGVSVAMKGCATKNMCGQKSDMTGTPGAEYKCCTGDLCNSASSTRVGLLLVVTSLISMYMIS